MVVAPASPFPTVKPGAVLTTMPRERTNRVALRLLTRARASEQEQGINTLFASFGLLRWQEKTGEATWRYAPLVMLPLKIEEQARENGFRISAAGEDPEFNQTLAERFKRDLGLTFSIDLDEETTLQDVFGNIRTAVAKQPGWDILEQTHVGHFPFHKLRMFTDLSEHVATAVQHDIVQALAMDTATIASMPQGVPTEEELDRAVSPQSSFSVLDADASQLRAIQAAVRGSHLIIQGPPGTGKSQTIANIIAECIAAGRTVLFVSEKAAAIEVVHRRLSERGLGDFCLMLHSHKANKREVIYDLGKRLAPEPPPAASPQQDRELQRLLDLRVQLNAYADALHRTRTPLQESAFWAHGQLASLHAAPHLAVVSPPIGELTHERLDAWTQLVSQLARYAEVLNEGQAHPWAGVRQDELTLADRESLKHTLTSLCETVRELRSGAHLLATKLELPTPTTLPLVRNIGDIVSLIPADGGLRPAWFDLVEAQRAEALVAEAAAHAATLRDVEERLFRSYTEDILSITTPTAIESYGQNPFVRLVSPSHRRLRAQMRSMAQDGQQRTHDDELSLLQNATVVNAHRAWFVERKEILANSLGVTIAPTDVSDDRVWMRKASAVAAAAGILARLPSGARTPAFVEAVCHIDAYAESRTAYQRLNLAIDLLDQQLADLQRFFLPGTIRVGDFSLFDAHLDPFLDWLEQRLVRFDDLDPWLRAQAALGKAEKVGLRDIIDHLLGDGIPRDQWIGAFRRLLLTHWLDIAYREDEILQTFNGEDHAALVAQFRELDYRSISRSAHRIRRELAVRQGQVSSVHGGEPAILRHEAQKRKRHMPLRRLFSRIPNLIPTLKPCLMMSPLSVVQFLPADHYNFDIVIFDEASQVRPYDAIGAIMRGKQLVVAGDSKQLPPTSFFDRNTDEEEFDEELDMLALESILDGLSAKDMPSVPLLWHYRSRHEDLIAYSNHHFYNRRLITFPSPARTPALGVRLEYVPNALYERVEDKVLRTPMRVNRVEARRVAQLVLHHAQTRPEESLGVVTLGTNQRDVVDDEIRAAVKQATFLDRSLEEFFQEDRSDRFFVKALEQVQGDERDVIMISIGYGKDAKGNLSHNFGPINRDGGERRLNVLVTRARNQVIVISSIRAGDIDLTKTQKLGPRLLKNYLDYAERGPIALEAEAIGGDGEYESPFEVEVGEALKRAGFDVHRQVGTSRFRIDLAIVDPRQPGRYILGIECDGKTYHGTKTARDRDRLRQEILEGLGWTIHRIWSTDWMRQRDRELQRVVSRVNELLDISSDHYSNLLPDSPFGSLDWKEPPTITEKHDASEQDLAQPHQDEWTSQAVRPTDRPATAAVPYEVATFEVPGYGDILSVPLASVADAIVTCVNIEAPIHLDLLARRIAAAWGYQRAGVRIGSRVETALATAVRQGRVAREGKFLWSVPHNGVVPRASAPDGTLREIAFIADEELLQGITRVLEQALSMTEDELERAA